MAVYAYVSGTLESAHRQADRLVSPDARKKAYEDVRAFAYQRPLLFSFLAAQLLFSAIPVFLFATFLLGTVAFSLVSAAAWSLFWTGVASLVLGGTVLVTAGFVALMWLWFVGAYIAANFVWGLVAGSAKSSEPASKDKWEKTIVKKEPEPEPVTAGHGSDGNDVNGNGTNGTQLWGGDEAEDIKSVDGDSEGPITKTTESPEDRMDRLMHEVCEEEAAELAEIMA